MDDWRTYAGQIAGLVSLAGFAPYLMSTVRGRTRPNRATWWIWTFVGAGLCASYFAAGARDSIWVPVSYVIGPFLTALASIKYGEGGWNRLDRICFGTAAVSFGVWGLTGSAMIALVMNLGVDISGAIPTIRKSYVEPESEDRTAWGLFLAGNTINLLALYTWSFAEAAYPLYLFAVAATVSILLARKPVPKRAVAVIDPGSG